MASAKTLTEASLRARLTECQRLSRVALQRRLDKLHHAPAERRDQLLATLAADIEHACQRRACRAQQVLQLDWPALPVVEQLERISNAIREHQVVVLAGETGSGKTTQLPKICLALGRGVDGMIAHTQPRRLAARAVASRVAEELHSSVGELVGFRVRFTDQVGEQCRVKLLTDGMLLSEISNDRFLDQYDTVIIDEAHERSLNIDFLLGYIRQLLPKRPDLKLIITSATIDHQRFSRHFSGAPVIEVSGRSYPVTVHYRPPPADQELSRQVEAVLREIEAEEKQNGRPSACDVLVFLSGEADIRALHHHLRRCEFRDTEFLPLYARLSAIEQQRVFSPHRGRRVVLSTNVAETSLTVPGIRYVIDAGTARVSRYSVQSKVQRLPVEPISQASAEQRKGRSGRLMPGVCYRLYDEQDFLGRPAFTEPEIQRTNLAAVILRMADLRLGAVADFPFIDAPESSRVRDGERLLEELGALLDGKLTALGRALAKLPVDPRLGRMLLRAAELGSLHELLIVVSALSVQDPRERPAQARQQADQAHQAFQCQQSDFLQFVRLWQWAEEQRQTLTRSAWQRLQRKRFLSPVRMQEWRDTHRQLLLQCRQMQLPLNEVAADDEQIHRALLSGLLSQVLHRSDEGEWLSSRQRKPSLWPGSALVKSKSRWLMAAELLETSRLFARLLARIEPRWIELEGKHLLRRSYLQPHWSKARGALMAREQLALYGLIIRQDRLLHYGPQVPAQAHEALIRDGLVAGALRREPDFVRDNRLLLERLQHEEAKLRRRSLLADEQAREAFYQARLPAELITLAQLEHWYTRQATAEQRQALRMTETDVLVNVSLPDAEQFPSELAAADARFPLQYCFEPGIGRDGVWIEVPLPWLNRLTATDLEWLVPGWLAEKLEALIRGLPKARRRHFVPVPDYVQRLIDCLKPRSEPLLAALTRELARLTGVRIEQEEWAAVSLPAHLRFHIRVLDGREVLAEGDDLLALQQRFAAALQDAAPASGPSEGPSGRDWVFGSLADFQERPHGGAAVRLWPALLDEQQQVTLSWQVDADQAAWQHRWGTARLLWLQQASQWRALRQYAETRQGFASKLLATEQRRWLDDALLRIVSDHFHLAQVPIRDQQAFRERLDGGRSELVAVAERQLDLWSDMLQRRAAMQRQLSRLPLSFAHAHADLKQQLSDLFSVGCLRLIPAPWLAALPRYLAAMQQRIDKLPGQISKDRSFQAELNPLYTAWQVRAGGKPLWQLPPGLVVYRFMLEEYRVSLFAQQLGTAQPVSAKRLKVLWQQC